MAKFGRSTPTMSSGANHYGGPGTTRVCQRIKKGFKLGNYYSTHGGVKLTHGRQYQGPDRRRVPQLMINNRTPQFDRRSGQTTKAHYCAVRGPLISGNRWARGRVTDSNRRPKAVISSTITQNGVESLVPHGSFKERRSMAFYMRRRSTKPGDSPPRRSWYKD